MKVEELNKETLEGLIPFFNFAGAIEHPEKFRELGLDPAKIDEIRKRLLTLALEVLSEKDVELELKEEGKPYLTSHYFGVLTQCTAKDGELHEGILDCLVGCMNRSIGSAAAAVESFYKLADVVPKEKWEGQISHLLNLLKTGNDTTSWNGAYALASLAPKMDDKFLQEQIGKILNIARSHTGFRKTHAVSCLGKLYHYADSREEILDTLLSSARDSSENMRRAAIFALEGCISDETKDRIFSCFEDLLEDEANMVKYGALEALTEVLPYRISDKALDRILGFLKADEQWVRWRVALALGKAYPKLDAKQREKAVSTLTELIRDKDIFVKVRAYEALLNIKKSAKREFPKVDKALKSEPDFVQHWVLYNSDLG